MLHRGNAGWATELVVSKFDTSATDALDLLFREKRTC